MLFAAFTSVLLYLLLSAGAALSLTMPTKLNTTTAWAPPTLTTLNIPAPIPSVSDSDPPTNILSTAASPNQHIPPPTHWPWWTTPAAWVLVVYDVVTGFGLLWLYCTGGMEGLWGRQSGRSVWAVGARGGGRTGGARVGSWVLRREEAREEVIGWELRRLGMI
ncbi:hypothetical protein BU26DRAFT_572467 [Trematosphaeria pertusa]|uniref:Uncharacterized protein n=1 Tax=Trematosphaeria pertusa TaxID=390896 RepID=A0A6A6HTW9_9PLEO|nr:uncharacterized protein BU26DRAFT_572467 [Trematosphaeria pertusa]KAF2240870.1 hypothetical protein BU26DRAFT_572467 [Trematosphaeria pertusa]